MSQVNAPTCLSRPHRRLVQDTTVTDNGNVISSTTAIYFQIPLNLIPTADKDCNIDWARQTWAYYHLFSDSDNSRTRTTNEDLYRWMSLANEIQKDLKKAGMEGMCSELIRLAKVNRMVMLRDGQPPTSIRDIKEIISDKQWYQEDQIQKRSIIYHMQYAIFRQGYNTWAYNIAHSWMDKYKVTYEEKENVRNTKGFVYRLIVNHASDAIAKSFQSVMKQSHGEYIAVRKHAGINKLQYTQHHWGPRMFLVIVCANETEILSHFRQAIKLAKKQGMTKNIMQNVMEEEWVDQGEFIILSQYYVDNFWLLHLIIVLI